MFVHTIYFYKDKQGIQPVLDYMREFELVCDNRTDGSNSTSSTTISNCWASREPVLPNPTSSTWMRRSGSWDFPGSDYRLGWMGVCLYCIILSKKTQRHLDERSRKPSGELQDLKERGLRDKKNSAIGSNWKMWEQSSSPRKKSWKVICESRLWQSWRSSAWKGHSQKKPKNSVVPVNRSSLWWRQERPVLQLDTVLKS